MIHVNLDEFEGLIFNHLDGLCVEQFAEVAELLSCYSFSVLGIFEGLLENSLYISQPLNAVTHT